MKRQFSSTVIGLAVGTLLSVPSGFTAEPRGRPREGIHVHGHWVIEVRNADGTLADRREFENALVGAGLLAQFLAHYKTIGAWRIQLTSAQPPCSDSIGRIPCRIVEPAFQPSPGFSNDLALTLKGNGLLLTGSIRAMVEGSVDTVATQIIPCDSSVPSVPICTGGLASNLTQAAVDPIEVRAGQHIDVSVQVTFS